MTITARPMVKSDARIRADIMSEIEWDPFIRQVPCKVRVENGAVTVTGQAPSLAASPGPRRRQPATSCEA